MQRGLDALEAFCLHRLPDEARGDAWGDTDGHNRRGAGVFAVQAKGGASGGHGRTNGSDTLKTVCAVPCVL